MSTQSNTGGPANATLETLAEQINASHQECLRSTRAAVEHARHTGTLLLQAQQEVPKGKWEEWVQDHCKFSVSTAQRYVKVANSYHKVRELEAEKLTELSLTEALRLVSDKSARGEGSPAAACPPLKAPSAAAVRKVTQKAAKLHFEDQSPEQQFIRRKVATLSREILRLAKKTRLKDDKGERLDPAQVAVALLEQLKDALRVELVVAPEEEGPRDGGSPLPAADGQPHAGNGVAPALVG